jgi:hypothetical protein
LISLLNLADNQAIKDSISQLLDRTGNGERKFAGDERCYQTLYLSQRQCEGQVKPLHRPNTHR